MTHKSHIPIPSANEDFLLLRLRGFSEMAHNRLNKCLVYNFVIPTVANFFRKYNFDECFIFRGRDIIGRLFGIVRMDRAF